MTSNLPNKDLVGAEGVQQHCPGPPKTVESRGNNLKPGGNDEIQQLRNELQLCQGKIKGYEILGHLFQESKQECVRYKMQNEELVKKIENLTTSHHSGLPAAAEYCGNDVVPLSSLNKPGMGSVKDSSYRRRDDINFELLHGTGHKQRSDESVGSDGRSRPSELETGSRLPAEHGRGIDLTEMGAKTPPAVPQGMASSGSSGSSSPSFVQISDTDVMSSASCSLKKRPSEPSSVTSTGYTATQVPADLSMEINHLTEQMKKIGQSGGDSVQDLSADLIRAGVSVLKLQKQNRVQQVLIDKMNAEIAELRANNDEKEHLIRQLEEDCKLLGNRVKQMEISRGKALQEAQTRILETAEDPEDNFAGPGSTEWVEVEKRTSRVAGAAAETAAGVDNDVVTAASMIEMELRRRVEKLSATITELVAVNRNWDEHCNEIEANHKQQMASMQNRLTELQNRVDEYNRSDQKRQLEFDNILLNCKQQRETEEMAKEDALDKLHRERQLRNEAELKCFEFSRKTVELETQLIELRNSQQQVRSSHYQTEPLQHQQHYGQQPMTAREQELCSQLVILQEQLNVFKEDFDHERSDRESARNKTEMLRRELAEARSRTSALQSQLASANVELRTTKNENEKWRQRCQKLTADLEVWKRQAQPVPQVLPRQVIRQPVSQGYSVQPTGVQPQMYAEFQPQQAPMGIRRPSWSCLTCTFKNSGTSSACAMCATPRSQAMYQTNFLPVGDRPVAGLQDYLPYQPSYSAATLISRSYGNDVIDDSKNQ